MTALTGGCACGAVRYESDAAPVAMVHCHCRDCQRSSGGAASSFAVVPADTYRVVQGAPRSYASASALGGETHRAFCADCGSPTHIRPDAAPQIVAIRVGSLDDPSIFVAQADVWTCDAQPWMNMDPAIPKFLTYPE